MDQEECQRRRNELVARYEAAGDGYEKASREISDRQGKRKTYMRFVSGLQKLDGIRFTFKAGNEVKVTGQVKMCRFCY